MGGRQLGGEGAGGGVDDVPEGTQAVGGVGGHSGGEADHRAHDAGRDVQRGRRGEEPVGGQRGGEVVEGLPGGVDRVGQGAGCRIARGTAPLLVAVASVTVLGRPLAVAEMAGVLVISAGLAGLAFADGWPGRAQLPALAAAVATGVVIAGYTAVDGTGVHRSQTVIGYIAWLFLCQGPSCRCWHWSDAGTPCSRSSSRSAGSA